MICSLLKRLPVIGLLIAMRDSAHDLDDHIAEHRALIDGWNEDLADLHEQVDALIERNHNLPASVTDVTDKTSAPR